MTAASDRFALTLGTARGSRRPDGLIDTVHRARWAHEAELAERAAELMNLLDTPGVSAEDVRLPLRRALKEGRYQRVGRDLVACDGDENHMRPSQALHAIYRVELTDAQRALTDHHPACAALDEALVATRDGVADGRELKRLARRAVVGCGYSDWGSGGWVHTRAGDDSGTCYDTAWALREEGFELTDEQADAINSRLLS